MTKAKRDSEQLKKGLEGRWLNALSALAPGLRPAINKLGQHVPCPVKGGVDGFRLFGSRDKYPTSETGGGVNNSHKIMFDGIELLMWVNRWSFTQTFDELAAWLGDKDFNAGPEGNSVTLVKQKVVDDTSMQRWLNRIWRESLPLDHTLAYPARAYFSSRRMLNAALAANNVRFHPQMVYKEKTTKKVLGIFGTVLCKVQNNDGAPVQISRLYLHKNGMKVDFDKDNKAKKQTPSVKRYTTGRYVKLFAPINGFIGVSEGLETALAVYQVKQFPVWPNLSNTNLHSFVISKGSGIHTVLNFVDNDRTKAGHNSAERLRAHLEPEGIRVIDLIPPTPILDTDKKGVDWADQMIRDPGGFDLIDQVLLDENLKQA